MIVDSDSGTNPPSRVKWSEKLCVFCPLIFMKLLYFLRNTLNKNLMVVKVCRKVFLWVWKFGEVGGRDFFFSSKSPYLVRFLNFHPKLKKKTSGQVGAQLSENFKIFVGLPQPLNITISSLPDEKQIYYSENHLGASNFLFFVPISFQRWCYVNGRGFPFLGESFCTSKCNFFKILRNYFVCVLIHTPRMYFCNFMGISLFWWNAFVIVKSE